MFRRVAIDALTIEAVADALEFAEPSFAASTHLVAIHHISEDAWRKVTAMRASCRALLPLTFLTFHDDRIGVSYTLSAKTIPLTDGPACARGGLLPVRESGSKINDKVSRLPLLVQWHTARLLHHVLEQKVFPRHLTLDGLGFDQGRVVFRDARHFVHKTWASEADKTVAWALLLMQLLENAAGADLRDSLWLKLADAALVSGKMHTEPDNDTLDFVHDATKEPLTLETELADVKLICETSAGPHADIRVAAHITRALVTVDPHERAKFSNMQRVLADARAFTNA